MKLFIDVSHMGVDCSDANSELVRDFFRSVAPGKQPQYVLFTR